MEVKIGVQQAPRELALDVPDEPDAVHALVTEAVAAGGVLSLTDSKGRTVIVPVDKLAYVDIGGVTGQVGFRT